MDWNTVFKSAKRKVSAKNLMSATGFFFAGVLWGLQIYNGIILQGENLFSPFCLYDGGDILCNSRINILFFLQQISDRRIRYQKNNFKKLKRNFLFPHILGCHFFIGQYFFSSIIFSWKNIKDIIKDVFYI